MKRITVTQGSYIYKLDDGLYVIADGSGWLPGVYDSEETARMAFDVSREQLICLQEQENKLSGYITLSALQSLAIRTAKL